jgi:endonuclease YncB( thermonuclease family)
MSRPDGIVTPAKSGNGGAKTSDLAPAVRPALAALAALAFLVGAATAEPLVPAGTARVAEVVDGDTVALDDGRQVRLVGLQAPKLPLGRPGFPTWPLAEEAKAALEGLVLGRTVELRHGGARRDRHGRALAHLYRDDGLWVQGEMLGRGLARVYTFADNRALAADLYARERAARAAGRGIWGHSFYALRTPETVGRDVGTFQVVEGRVVKAARVKGTVFLNFGPDWRTDFTARIAGGALKLFAGTGVDPLALEGRTVQLRGWVSSRDGPMIELTHPEQIEAPP